ncbi:HEATR5B [Cordylochernes scorpioides]|uniref:HEATR5B n=1 Tax=Cordylochernes scorpioides TaxID=51811 RepID=A0ABY6LH90_9ARAC|nr:HEATR5B [Cordylochernes scorpioides]
MLCGEDPICTFCNSKLKNEITHYIFDCSALKEERRTLMLKTGQLCASLPSIIDNMTQNKYIATAFYGFHKSLSQKKANFLQFCKELVTEEVTRRILSPVESGLVMLINGMLTPCSPSLGPVTKSYGQHLKASVTMVRLRLYETLLLLPPHTYEGSYHNLLRLLVAEFSLTENPANTTTSLLRGLCRTNDCLLSDFWLPDSDQSIIEAQLQPNSASGSGALEHDVTALYKSKLQEEEALPLGVAVIDASVELFGAVFPGVALKHRLQMLSHFAECLKHSKATRQEAVQVNIFTAVLYALKALMDHKNNLGTEEVKSAAIKLILGSLSHPNPILRCAAAEALGRMAQVVGDSRFVGEVAQQSFDRLRTARDAATRTGLSLALGCLHRYVGGMGSGKHLSTSVSILLALAQDSTAPVVQAWAVHALAMIADSGGPMFRSYVEPTLDLCLQGALGQWNTGVLRGVGKLAGALVNCVGPETGALAGSTLACCAALVGHTEPLVRAEAIGCLQQLHMFGPRHLALNWLVPLLCRSLTGAHLGERRAAAACLRQLSQRQAQEVAAQAGPGLEEALFSQMDYESDSVLLGLLRDCLGSLLGAAPLGRGLGLCKSVLTDSGPRPSQDDQLRDAEDGEEDARFHAVNSEEVKPNSSAARWPTRVFAAQCLQKLVLACEGCPAHFDLALARDAHALHPQGTKCRCVAEDYLVLHLSDLVRMSFMAATSDSSPLRLEGLGMLQLVIDNFARAPEPEFPGHVLLEQFQAQVGAALRPAFSPDTPPHITALACQVCSAWIGSGVARDLADLRRVHQLLVSSMAKLNLSRASLYNEAMSTLEKLAILKAWAEVYVVAMEETQKTDNSLLSLVTPELTTLSHHWLAALKDHALLSLPPEFNSQLPHEGGAFYTADTMDAVKPFYRDAWPSLLYAAVLWLCNSGELESTDSLHLLLGSCMETLCSPPSSTPLSVALRCLQSMSALLSHPAARAALTEEPPLCVELCHVLHRLLLTRPESPECQSLALEVCRSLADCWLDQTRTLRGQPGQEEAGEGGETGDLLPLKSLVFALLENCLCVVLRHLPQLGTRPGPPVVRPLPGPAPRGLMTACLDLLGLAPELCSPAGSVTVLPVSLHLILGVMGEMPEVSTEGVEALRKLLSCLHLEGPQRSHWVSLLQSAMSRLVGAGPSEAGLAALQVFLLEAPVEVASAPNLLYPCINLLRQALLAGSPALQLACTRLLRVAFSHQPHRPAVTLPLIHALAPRLLSLLGSITNGGTTAPELLRECFSALLGLLEAAPIPHRSQLLGLYIPLLAGQLQDQPTTLSPTKMALHEAALQILLQVGPRYPQEFRSIVAAQPQVRRKLEACCGGRTNLGTNSRQTPAKSTAPTPPPPSIKLKTDFSNFSG